MIGCGISMKWKNKGKELETVYARNASFFKRIEAGIWLFGAGKIGQEEKDFLEKNDLRIKGFVDNNNALWGRAVKDSSVISFEEYCHNHRDEGLIISVGEKARSEITKQLDRSNLIVNKEYVYHDSDMILLAINKMTDRVVVPVTQICLTERCTLKCKKCAHGCHMVDKSKKDLSLNEAKKSADAFFSFVDYCKEFVLIGGEPFLYSQICEIIDYVGHKYRYKMGLFTITTNGTITPSDEILTECRSKGVTIRISNYSETIPNMKNKIERLIDKLEEYKIDYRLAEPDINWMDYGFDDFDRGKDENELIKTFNRCRTVCHEIRGDRFYFCVMARAVSENMGFDVGADDYLDLSELEGNNGKKVFFEYLQGYSDKGYLDMCRYCHGAESIEYPISPAEQA